MNQSELKQILASKFDFEVWKSILETMFLKIDYLSKEIQIDASLVKSGGQVGTIRLDDGRSLGLFKFEVADNIKIARNRKGLRDIAIKYVDQDIIHGALVFYYSNQQADYRLTFVSKQTSLNANGELETKVTAPKRYTFLLGENEPCTTASIRLKELIDESKITLSTVTDVFSVERLNKDFFAGYYNQYSLFLKYLNGITHGNTKANRDYVKKLLGRLVFLQFLQKRGWMGVPAVNKDWEGGDRAYMSHLVERNEGNNRILSDVLEPLFFNTLNERRTDDLADSRLGENIRIPYLNGGLFDKDEIDRKDIDFPYSYFKNLMDFFSMYNFTIDENDPDDSEVGIDPEMLGHIFENLLENNNEKGAYYTPKEIVQYMCQESISLYLKSHIDGQFHTAVDNLIKKGIVDSILQEKTVANIIYKLLRDIKVCDPAIGSGAFPMGILNVLYHARLLLYGFTKPGDEFIPSHVKREIIQQNVFGVDIEQGAVDIARLRFWLALVVDEKKPMPLPNLDYKIVCGDSLLNRIDLDEPIDAVFNIYNEGKDDVDQITLAKYKQLVADYTNASDHKAKEEFKLIIESIKDTFKSELADKKVSRMRRLKRLISDLNAPSLFEQTKKETDRIKKYKAELAVLEKERADIESNKLYESSFEWRYQFPALLDENGEFLGFDVVIGNPPYLRIQGIKKSNPLYADELVKNYQSATGAYDLYAIFTERGLQIINNRGIVNYIMPVKWTNASFGKGIREYISQKKAAYKIINFGAYQVFDASTYTGLQWFMPNSSYLKYFELNRNLVTNHELKLFLDSLNDDSAEKVTAEKLNKEQWTLTTGDVSSILSTMALQPRQVKTVFNRIFCGLQTSKDDVYFLYECYFEGDYIVGESKLLAHNIKIERGLVKPLLKGEDVHRYDHIITDRYVIFPYKLIGGKAVLYTEAEISNEYPMGYAYLKDCEEVLRGRENGKLQNDNFWFRYIYPKNLNLFDKEKLVAPDISLGGNFAYDREGEFYQTTTIYGYIKKKEVQESYKFWMALLNSRLCWWFLTNTGTTLANGYFRYKPGYINRFPIPAYEQTQKVHNIIDKLVNFLLYLYDKDNSDIYIHTSNSRVIKHIEEIVDMIIYELYFEEHMKAQHIDIISDMMTYQFDSEPIMDSIKKFYDWYQQPDNSIRQKLLLLETRSKNFINKIHTTATTYEQNK